MMRGYYGGIRSIGMMGSWSWVWIIVGVIVLVLLVMAAIAIVRALKGDRKTQHGVYDRYVPGQEGFASALGILNERYARGEISTEAFTQMKADILKGPLS
jgi:uncharacterized membrane protein